MSRKQYYIDSYNFRDIKEQDDKLIFFKNDKTSYSISENTLFKKLYEITGRAYKEETINSLGELIKAKPQDNPLDGLFILKANNIRKDKMNMLLYEKLIREGCYIEGEHYIYSEKSASMIRNQKTIFIKESIIKTLQEYLTLGKQPNKCVTAKWITTAGYLLSSVDVVNMLPRIVIIQDFNKIINQDVYIMEDFKPTDEDKKQYDQYLSDKTAYDEEYKIYKKQKDQAKELFKGDYLPKYFNNNIENGDDIKSTYRWKSVGRRPKINELLKPYSFGKLGKNYYPTYHKSQTEEIKTFPVKPNALGKDKVLHKNYACEINCFDGEGLGSEDFFNKTQGKLGVKFKINSLQIRLPYIKSNVIRVDWKSWMLQHGIREITPMSFNNEPAKPVNIMDIDIIITESCFKAKLEKAGGKNPWLFESMDEYYDLLKKYNYNYFGITNYSHEHSDNEYNTLTYQFINSTELTYKDLIALCHEEANILKSVRRGDIAYTKAFLNIIANKNNMNEFEDDDVIESDDDFKDKAKVIMQMIKSNESIIHDKEVQKFLFQRIKNYYEDMLIGKILVPSQFLVATGDIIAFLEWTAWRNKDKVKGFLNADEFYCNGKEKEWVMTRYPLCHFSEIKIANFISQKDSENYKWIKHLDNIVQFNIYDLTMPRLNEDFDGDKNLLIKADTSLSYGKILKDAIINDYIIYNPDDKTTTVANKFDIDAIFKFEGLNLDNKTGLITNLNSTYQTKAHSEGSLGKRDLESSVCKMLQGEQIDSVKKGTSVIIPDILKKEAWQKPYFMKHSYGEDDNNKNAYMIPISPLDKFSEVIESIIKKLYSTDTKEELNISDDKNDVYTYKILTSYVDSDTELKLMKALQPIFNNYSHEKGRIYRKSKGLNRLSSSEDDKENIKQIKQQYRELYSDTREKSYEAYRKLFGKINEKVLASVCMEIEYVQAKEGLNGFQKNKSFNFPWIVCPEGLIANIEEHEDSNKTLLTNTTEKIEKGKNAIDCFGKLYKVTSEVKKNQIKEAKQPEKINNKKVLALKDYKCNLVNCNGKAAAEKLNDNVAKLRLKDNKYYSFYVNDEYVASVTKGNEIDLKKGINLKNYVGQEFYIEVDGDGIKNKSLKAILQSA